MKISKEETNKILVNNYLTKHYLFTLSTISTYKLYDRISKQPVGLREVFSNILKIFGITEEELRPIFESWSDEKSKKLMARVIEIKETIREKTGFKLELSAQDINTILIEEAEEESEL